MIHGSWWMKHHQLIVKIRIVTGFVLCTTWGLSLLGPHKDHFSQAFFREALYPLARQFFIPWQEHFSPQFLLFLDIYHDTSYGTFSHLLLLL